MISLLVPDVGHRQASQCRRLDWQEELESSKWHLCDVPMVSACTAIETCLL